MCLNVPRRGVSVGGTSGEPWIGRQTVVLVGPASPSSSGRSLVVEDLMQSVHHRHKVSLIGHDLIDVLVRLRSLVEQLIRRTRLPIPTTHGGGQSPQEQSPPGDG